MVETVKARHYTLAHRRQKQLPPCLRAPCAAPHQVGGSTRPAPRTSSAAHCSPPSASASRLASGLPENTPGTHTCFITYFRLGKTKPFHFIASRMVAVYLGSFLIFPSAKLCGHLCNVLADCRNQRCFPNNPVTPKLLRNSRDKIVAAVRAIPEDTVPNTASGSCCARQRTNLQD